MATNKVRWIRNINGATEPLLMLGKFQAGATAAVKRGEILSISSTNFIPVASEAAAIVAASLAIANEEIKSGDRAGYYEIIVPRPGDIFEYASATAAAWAAGSTIYYSSSEAVSTTGTTELGRCAGQVNYPLKQGHLADDGSPDAGTTIRSTGYVHCTFKTSISYYAAVVV